MNKDEIIETCVKAYQNGKRCEFEYAVTQYSKPLTNDFVKRIKKESNYDFSDCIFESVECENAKSIWRKGCQLMIINVGEHQDFISHVNNFFADELIARRGPKNPTARAFIFFEHKDSML